MNEFYVEKRSNENDEHLVHKHTCPALPGKDTLRWIGVRSNNAAPLKEAGDVFPQVIACPQCMAG